MGKIIFRSSLQERGKGFSIIEVLCALGIMMVLLIVFFRIYSHRDNEIKCQVAKEELSLLNCALEYYYTANGTYPSGNQQSIEKNAVSLYDALSKASENFLLQHSWKLAGEKVMDPWGRPYVYKFSGKQGDNYLLFSVGPNGHIDESDLIDDIYSR